MDSFVILPRDYALVQSLSNETIGLRFERQAIEAPDNLAIVTDERSLTYRELAVMSDRVAARLHEVSTAPERPVVVMMDDAPLLIASMIGAAKANRPFIPLEQSSPEAWLSRVVADSGTAHILADRPTRSIAGSIAGAHATVLEIEAGDWVSVNPFKHPNVHPDSPACIMYTSGSTGRPKGVALTHRGVLHRSARGGRPEIYPRDRVAHLRAGGFVPGRTNVFATLFSGACIFPFEISKHGLHKYASWLNAHRITGFTITSSLFRAWLASLPEEHRFQSLRLITCISEPLYGVDVERAARHLTGDWIIEYGYGTTEVGRLAGNVVGPTSLVDQGVLPVGHVLPDYNVCIEKEDGTLARSGEVGEIIVRTPYLAHSYWNEPELTATTFAADPASRMRLYRTGDLGRWLDDCQLQHCGRKDRRIKVRGYTIELHEVECALLQVSGVRDAIVACIPDEAQGQRLVAYVVAPHEVSAPYVRDRLAELLPAYMVPADIIVQKSIPLTVSGKVDRAALPLPNKDVRHPYRAPSDEQEKALALIWQEILKLPRVGIDDEFYDLGGTSFQAFMIFARIANTLGHDLPPTTMMNAPTIARQAETLRAAVSVGKTSSKVVPFREHGRGSPLFFVHGGRGDIMFVKEIVRDLKSDHPVYGLQPPSLNGKQHIPRTVEGIAADYIAEIVRIQQTGPYYFAGYSFGGCVALEMAQQLARKGERVAFVGIIDTPPTLVEPPASRIARHARALKRSAVFPYVTKRLKKTLEHYAVFAGKAVRHLPNEIRTLLGRPIPYSERTEFFRHIYTRAARRYATRAYLGDIVLFSRADQVNVLRARWSGIARGQMTVHEIPGDHGTLVWPPHSAALAGAIDASLRDIGLASEAAASWLSNNKSI